MIERVGWLFHPTTTSVPTHRRAFPVPDRTGVLRGMNTLTPRERDCALLAAEGLHNLEIAQKLGKSIITVRNQLTSIYRKMGIDSRSKLVAAFTPGQ